MTIAARAAYILRETAPALITKASPSLYPHQWSWTPASTRSAWPSLTCRAPGGSSDALFAGQWRNGMVPHIVFDPVATGYWPGPEQWLCSAAQRGRPQGTRDQRDH